MGSEDDQPAQRRTDDSGGTVGADASSSRDQIGYKPFGLVLSARVPIELPQGCSDPYRRIRNMRQYSPEFRERALRLLDTTMEASDVGVRGD